MSIRRGSETQYFVFHNLFFVWVVTHEQQLQIRGE